MNKIPILLLLLFANFVFAQEKKPKVHLETIDSKNIKREIDANCFVLSFLKSNSNFAVILFDKNLLSDAREIKVYLNQQQKNEPLVITIPIDVQNVVQSGKLVGIPYSVIRQQTKDMGVIQPTFFPENLVLNLMKGVTEKEKEDFKLEMEKWIEN